MKHFVMRSHPRNKTGCVGISIARNYRAHPKHRRPHNYFVVRCGVHSTKRFNIDSLGRQKAWRLALKFRAEHERAVAAALSRRVVTGGIA